MTESVACPACGTTFERETLEKARNAVAGHMVSKVDDDHHGIGYQKALQMMDFESIQEDITLEDDHPATPAPESPGATAPSDPAETDGGRRVQDLPTFEEYDPDEHGAADVDQGAGDDESCDKCGGPLDDVDVLPDEVLERYPVLQKMVGVCIPCSTDEDGEWTSPIEVKRSD